ncbi:type I polyketide synthase [Bradymonas sediminis]|uniref:Uncharacterized protein n=1 Tax=Bradymonas sediminis TaxID=1548548 RepID=A0A2Z4FL23_9DELT|nr:type I polyketide synthase [Bradymonas sediminis]AWV89505.1 hypothetical protein DN745_09190 [Bradymonas sediminis]TDP76767.1 malonyl CoA-acyl carrier protein transacylase [Bradymonas sediminis]
MTNSSRANSIAPPRSVAIIGIGTRVPGALSTADFWQNILNGHSAISEVPRDRWNPDLYWDEDRDALDKTYSKIGGWITDFEFERKKYRIPPMLVESMDPTQTLVLEATHEAFEDAGYLDKDFDRERCAVILGNAMGGDLRDRTNLRIFYAEVEEALRMSLLESVRGELSDAKIEQVLDTMQKRFRDPLPRVSEDSMPGELANVVAGRVAALFNLRGPNFITDAACASSLAAINTAIHGLQSRQYDMAVSGGVDRCMGASTFVKFSKIGALSADGSRPFDANANGFVMGEGGAILIMKRLEDAQRDGDKIYAVIRGVGASSDGKGKGITAPNPIGQKLSVRRAYADAGYGPRSVSLFEAHGTSTPVGDPIEANSLLSVIGEDSGDWSSAHVGIGSVKSMIGHLKAGAGAASLAKIALALKHKTLAPSINCVTPNPAIEFAGTPLRVQTQAEPWETRNGAPRRAGVSAFGFGGTNFHITLEEYDPDRASQGFYMEGGAQEDSNVDANNQGVASATAGNQIMNATSIHEDGILTFSAATEADAQRQFEAFAADFEARGLAATAAHRLPIEAPHFALPQDAVRLAISYASEDGLKTQVERIQKAFERGRGWKILANQGIYLGTERTGGRMAMLFPGQGSQYIGMLDNLRERYPIVQATFDEADAIMAPVLGRPLSSIIFPDPSDLSKEQANELLRQTEVTQPAVLTVDIALLRLFKHFGIEPDMVAGHSLGEYGACVAAGVMSFADALRTVAARGTQMAKATPLNGDKGLMASIPLPADEVEAVLRNINGYVVCANKNCPKQTIIAGLTDAVKEAVSIFEGQGHLVHILNVSHAFHTRVVAAASEPLRKHLSDVAIATPRVPILTNVTGGFYPTDPDEIRDLLAEQLASPVEFITQIEKMYEAGARVFVEIGPKRTQATFVSATLGKREHLASYSNHPKEGDIASLHNILGRLWAHGAWTQDAAKAVSQTAAPAAAAPAASAPAQPATPAAMPSDLSTDAIRQTLLDVLCEKTGYDPDEIEFDFELEADLGIDTVKQAEIMADVREHFQLAKDEEFRLADYPTLERMAAYVVENLGAAPAAAPQAAAPQAADPVAQAAPVEVAAAPQAAAVKVDPAAIRQTLLDVLCEKTGYDPDEIEFDFELEADLGIDTVKQAEIMADVRERFQLAKDEEFRLADYPTLARMAEYVVENLGAAPAAASTQAAAPVAIAAAAAQAPAQAAAPQAAKADVDPSAIRQTLLDVLCEKTGYDPDEIEFDFELEADLGIDTVKQAEIMADVREHFQLAKDEEFRLADYPTLARMAEYVVENLNNPAAAATTVVDAPEQAAAREVRSAPAAVAAPTGSQKYQPHQHAIPARISITGSALGLPGLEGIFDENAIDRLLAGDNFISDVPMAARQEMVDKYIVRVQKHANGGGELVKVEDVAEVIKLAGRALDGFDLADWGVSERMIEQFDHTSRLAIAAGINALRDAGLPMIPRYRETRNGSKITIGWQLPEAIGDETGIIFASAFAGEDALIDEVTRRYTDPDYQFDHRFLLKVLGMANARFAEMIGARGPNTRINNACASTTTAMGMAEDWIRAGRCKRVVIISADDASGETLMNWVGSGFLATGAATTQARVEDAALPFDKRRHGMIIGMGAVALVIEAQGLAEARGVEPIADILSTHFVNSAFHPTRLDVEHIAGEVGKAISRAEVDFKLDRKEIADKMVFVSHETYTPARGGSADAEIAALRDNFGDKASDIVVANTKGFTGHAMGAGIEDVLAIKTLQKQRVPHIANFKEPDPNLGDLRLSQGGDYPVDYALRMAAGFGSQLAVALLRFRARTEDRVFDPALYQRWLGELTGFENPELTVEQRTLRVVEGQPQPGPEDPKREAAPAPTPQAAPKAAPAPVAAKPVVANSVAPKIPAPKAAAPKTAVPKPVASNTDVDAATFEPRPIVVEAHTAAAYDLLELQAKLSGKNIVILNGPMLVTNMVLRAVERCGATVHLLDDNAHRSPLDSEDTVIDLSNESEILSKFNEIGKVDGIVNLLGYGQDADTADAIHRAARQTYHVARAWQQHLGQAPGADNLFVSITGMGGRLGFDSSTRPLPMCGAICGLTKALGREWSDAAVRVVDVAREGFYPELGLQILSQVHADAPSLEVGLIGGVRYVPVIVDAELLGGHGSTQSYAPNKDSVVLVIGGARGITAEVALDMAKRFGPKLALVGRSKLTHPNPLEIDLAAEKRQARARIQASGERVTPVRIRQELKPLKSQIEIAQNIARMKKAGAQAEYFSCDVADPASVAVLVERVASRFGKVDGVIHAAGVEESKFLADKDAASFDRVFCGKAVGGLNLWQAVRAYNPSFFITFSSVAGRFGNEGQVDYSAANEVLNKLVAQINATTDTRGLSIDWTAWGDVGMATHGSMSTILEARGVEFLPVEIGAPIVGNAMERGLTGEYLVAGALGEMAGEAALERSALTGEDVFESDQYIFADRVTEVDDNHIVIERVFDPERDYFINDHVYQGVALLPGVMGFEFMVEAASQFVQNHNLFANTNSGVLEVSDVSFEHAIKFHHGEALRAFATATVHSRHDAHIVLDVILETSRTAKTGRRLDKQHFSARVTIGQAQTQRPEPMVLDANATYQVGPDKREIYRRFFHTGSFQVLEKVPHIGESVVIGYGRNPTGRLSASQNGHVFISDPMVREMALQTAGLWGMKNNGRSYLPMAIGRAMQFGVAQPGEEICIRCRRRNDAQEHTIAFDVDILTQKGELLQIMENVQLIGHRLLSEDEQFGEFPTRRLSSRRFTLPEAELLLSDLGLDADAILTDGERAEYERFRSDTRKAEWLAARVAAKDLIHCHLRNFYGLSTPLGDVTIAKDAQGAPFIELRGDSQQQMASTPLPSLTITHSNGVAIAAIAAPGPSGRAGVDLEAIEARVEAFADDYFSAAERALKFPESIHLEDSDPESALLSTLWSIKEAVSKALGAGLHLTTSEIQVSGLRVEDGFIRAAVNVSGRAKEALVSLSGDANATGEVMEVRARIDASFVLAYAWFATTGTEVSSAPSVEPKRVAPATSPSPKAAETTAPKSTDTDSSVPDDAWVNIAAVAALLKHKGLLGRLESSESKIESEKISPWKQS